MFFLVSTSLAYITIPKNKGNIKITWDKKLTTTLFGMNDKTIKNYGDLGRCYPSRL